MALLDNYEQFAKFEDFKDLYKDMLQASRKEPKDSLDLLRVNKLMAKVDEAFNRYKAEDKLKAVEYLATNGLVPQEWLELQRTFGGEFKSITNTDGLNNFRRL